MDLVTHREAIGWDSMPLTAWRRMAEHMNFTLILSYGMADAAGRIMTLLAWEVFWAIIGES